MSTMNPTVKRILPWAPLIVALILGLSLGLLIGWVWWPVSWTNASLVDLAPSQQAAYVASVAEAYRYDGTQAAARAMEARLAPLGANTDDAITNAIAYYRGLPTPDELAVSNLALLATDLGIPVDAAMMAPAPGPLTADTGAADAGAADASAATAAAPAEESGGSGVLTWLLAVFLSVGLIGAGFYLLMRLRSPRELTDSMKEPSAPAMPGDMQPVAGGASGPTRTTAWSRSDSAAAVAADDDLSFEDEDEEEPAARFSDASGDTGAPDAEDDFAPVTPRYATARDDASNYDEYSGSSYDAPATDDDALGARLPARSSAPSSAPRSSGPGGGPVPADAPPVDINALTPPSWAAAEPKGGGSKGATNAISTIGPVAVAAKPAPAKPAPVGVADLAQSAPASRKADASTVVTTGVAVVGKRSDTTPAARPAGKAIASFTLQYYTGMPDYIEALNITDPATGHYIGECGMGVSGKNPVLHDDPNQVIALEVWLYDNLDPRDNVSSTRVLLCPYAVARNLAQAFGDGSGEATLEARKGARFQVEGRNLVLDGELQDVAYDGNGVFRTAKVQLTVRARHA